MQKLPEENAKNWLPQSTAYLLYPHSGYDAILEIRGYSLMESTRSNYKLVQHALVRTTFGDKYEMMTWVPLDHIKVVAAGHEFQYPGTRINA